MLLYRYWRKECAPEVEPLIIDLESSDDEMESDASDLDSISSSLDVDDSGGFCSLCGRSEEAGRWFGCDYCDKWQHGDCMAPRHRTEALKSVGTARWQCFSCKSLQGRVTGHLCCVICFQSDGVEEGDDRGGWIRCLGGGDCPLACHAGCLPSTENWMCPSCQRSEA